MIATAKKSLSFHRNSSPSLAEVRERAAAIRAGWSDSERQKRASESQQRLERLLDAIAVEAA